METERTDRVIVGVDDTLSGMQALRRAVLEARARDVPLLALRAFRPAQAGMYPTLADQRQADAAAASQLVARAFADTMGGQPRDLEVEIVLVGDAPGPALIRYSSRAGDLLVLGSRQHGRWRRLAGRGVAGYCLAHAGCPVLVVPPPPLTRAGSPRALLRELRRELDQLAGGGPGSRLTGNRPES